MRRRMTIILALILCAVLTVPGLAEGNTTMAITLSETTLEIGTGNKIKLTAETESTEKLKFTWESSDKKIASVDANGTVAGVAEGEAVITCTAKLNKETVATAQCTVKVFTSVKSVKATSPVKGNVLFINQPTQIGTTVAPDNATYPKLVWTSSDESIATVDENGIVTAHQPGKVKITCATDQPNQAKAITADTQFTVKQQVEKIQLDAEALVLWPKDTVPEGTDTAEISLEVLPENANDRKVKWEISDKDVAQVNNGKVTAKKAGACTLTVTAADGGGATAICDVFVLSPSPYRFSAYALKDTGVAFTEDPGKATETAGRILQAALERLDEIDNTSRAAMLRYFARTAAANGSVFLTGSTEDETVPVILMMSDDRGNCAMLTYDSIWNTFYFSAARQLARNDFPQAAIDGEAFGKMIPDPAPTAENANE